MGIWADVNLPSLPKVAIPLVWPIVATAGTDITLPFIVILDASILTPPSTLLLAIGNPVQAVFCIVLSEN